MGRQEQRVQKPRPSSGAFGRTALVLIGGLAVASAAPPPRFIDAAVPLLDPPISGELAVLTYNVKGLPWPAASGREQALERIAQRLGAMRRDGSQPGVVVLQEAFTPEAKAIGKAAGYAWQVQGPHARTQPGNPDGGSWYYGETQPAILDSGLVVLRTIPPNRGIGAKLILVGRALDPKRTLSHGSPVKRLSR